MNGNVLHAPISATATTSILDVGCGTGAVTRMLGTKFPAAQVYGLDISPVPLAEDKPANVTFLRGNAVSQPPTTWTMQDGAPSVLHEQQQQQQQPQFDLLFSRLLVAGMDDWPGFIAKEYQLLKPGGWVEIQDLDCRFLDDDGRVVSSDWAWYESSYTNFNMDPECGKNARGRLEDAGFTDIQVHEYRMPVGVNDKDTPAMQDFGRFQLQNILKVYTVFIQIETKRIGLGEEEVKARLALMEHDITSGAAKHNKFFVTVGRKPE